MSLCLLHNSAKDKACITNTNNMNHRARRSNFTNLKAKKYCSKNALGDLGVDM